MTKQTDTAKKTPKNNKKETKATTIDEGKIRTIASEVANQVIEEHNASSHTEESIYGEVPGNIGDFENNEPKEGPKLPTPDNPIGYVGKRKTKSSPS